MTNTVKLYGGPMDGDMITLPEGQDHFHLLEPVGDVADWSPGEADPVAPVVTRECMYSRVGKTTNFEWDGWRGHDQ